MRDEDNKLGNMYLQQATRKEAFRFEEEAFEQRQKEIHEDFRMKKLDAAH